MFRFLHPSQGLCELHRIFETLQGAHALIARLRSCNLTGGRGILNVLLQQDFVQCLVAP